MLNKGVERQIEIFGERSMRGDYDIYRKLHRYINKATKAGLISLENAREIYDTYLKAAGAASNEIQLHKFERTIKTAKGEYNW